MAGVAGGWVRRVWLAAAASTTPPSPTPPAPPHRLTARSLARLGAGMMVGYVWLHSSMHASS